MKQRHLALLANLTRRELAGRNEVLVAIDGASALGKSTVARNLARLLWSILGNHSMAYAGSLEMVC